MFARTLAAYSAGPFTDLPGARRFLAALGFALVGSAGLLALAALAARPLPLGRSESAVADPVTAGAELRQARPASSVATHEHLGFFDDRDPGSSAPLDATNDLPVAEIVPDSAGGELLAVIISGDGGWNGLDRRLGKRLAERGVSVVGLDSKRYFAGPRSPNGTSRDVARLLRHYLQAWHKDQAMLIGYSRGADVLPFVAAHLPGDLRPRVALVAVIGSDGFAQFENGNAEEPDTRTLEVLPEILALRGMHPICVYGVHEAKSVCTDLAPDQAAVLARPGDHAFRGDDGPLARALIYESGHGRRLTESTPGHSPDAG